MQLLLIEFNLSVTYTEIYASDTCVFLSKGTWNNTNNHTPSSSRFPVVLAVRDDWVIGSRLMQFLSCSSANIKPRASSG